MSRRLRKFRKQLFWKKKKKENNYFVEKKMHTQDYFRFWPKQFWVPGFQFIWYKYKPHVLGYGLARTSPLMCGLWHVSTFVHFYIPKLKLAPGSRTCRLWLISICSLLHFAPEGRPTGCSLIMFSLSKCLYLCFILLYIRMHYGF